MSHMVEDPEYYFQRLVPKRSALLQELEARAAHEKVPIVGPVVGELLYLLARLMRPRRILELGTAIGYSAIHLGQACRETGAALVTVEIDDAMARRARDNLSRAGLDRHVEVRCVNALEALSKNEFEGGFDMVFMDIEKEDYLRAYPLCGKLLRPGGLLVVDNTAFSGAEAFNRALRQDPEWRWVNLYALLPGHSPLHDGLCLALRAVPGNAEAGKV